MKTVHKVIDGILIIGLAIIFLIFMTGIFYAMPSADDFNFMSMLKGNKYYPNLLPAIFSQSVQMYIGWQGAWFTYFLDMVLVGITQLNPIGIRIYLFISYFLFVFSILYSLSCSMYSSIAQIGLLQFL